MSPLRQNRQPLVEIMSPMWGRIGPSLLCLVGAALTGPTDRLIGVVLSATGQFSAFPNTYPHSRAVTAVATDSHRASNANGYSHICPNVYADIDANRYADANANRYTSAHRDANGCAYGNGFTHTGSHYSEAQATYRDAHRDRNQHSYAHTDDGLPRPDPALTAR